MEQEDYDIIIHFSCVYAILSAVFVSTPLAAENVLASCVGWGKYAHISEEDPNRFSATWRAHLCFDYLWEQVLATNSSFYITLNGGDTLKAVMW